MPLAYLIQFHAEKAYLFSSRESRFEYKQLVTITISENSIIWLKKKKELLYEGKMFDVKQYSSKNGEAVITGYFDGEEDALTNQFCQHLENKQHNGDGSGIFQFFKLFSEGNISIEQPRIDIYDNTPCLKLFIPERIPNIFGTVPTPPPLC